MIKKAFDEPDVKEKQIEELSAKLLVANQKLKESEMERTRMLENISHDLRAPLTAIYSSIEYLYELIQQQDMDRKELTRVLNIMNKRAGTLEILIQDLFFLTCMDNDKQSFKFEIIPFAEFLTEYFFMTEADDKYKDRKLQMIIPDNSDVLVKIDVNLMTRVLDNLFTNALKYSFSGDSITLGIAEVSDNSIVFYVKDTGIGISAQDIPHIFERTYMVSNSRSPQEKSGSGLGLAIVQSIMQHHHGKVWCESNIGKGSQFFCEIPIG